MKVARLLFLLLVAYFFVHSNVSRTALADQIDQPRIVGGEPVTDFTKVPFIAHLYHPALEVIACGATVISPTWLLTASHCSYRLNELVLYAGSLKLGTGQKLNIRRTFIHPKYLPVGAILSYDFMLIQLAEPIDFEKTGIQALSLASSVFELFGRQGPGKMMTVLGWGDMTNGDNRYPTRLRSVELPIVSRKDANQPESYDGKINESMLPAGFPLGGKDSCSGDSGGPMFTFDPALGKNVLVGVTSFGNECGLPNKYGIYAKVSIARNWILRTMRENP